MATGFIKAKNGEEIEIVDAKARNMLVVETITQPTTISSGNIMITIPITKSGYTPIGIVGWNLNDRGLAGIVNITGMIISQNNAIVYGASTQAKQFQMAVTILYKEN